MTEEKNNFISKDQDLIGRRNANYLRLILLLPMLLFAVIAIGYSIALHDYNREGRTRRGKIRATIDGVSHMSFEELIIAIIISILIALLILSLLNLHYKKNYIIIEMKFNDDRKELTITRRNINEESDTQVILYKNLKVSTKLNLSDGLSNNKYHGLALLDNQDVIGYIFKNHFTWTSETYKEIDLRLMKFI